ncbi:MAG TPA: hypothetical protein VFU02_03905, partial [Polyangiaceae bacterium]|nr:hypothetical protein [Polyangiaceae bacterium]
FVALREGATPGEPRLDLSAKAELEAHCREHLAGYKQPKAIEFLNFAAFPRSASGKVQRHELEQLLRANAKANPRTPAEG